MGINCFIAKKFVDKKIFVNTVDKNPLPTPKNNFYFLFNLKENFYFLKKLSTKTRPLIRI